MAIRQAVPISITLVGNGIATSYAFKLGDVLGVNTAGKGLLINVRAIPTTIEGGVVELPDNKMTASVTSSGLISLNFAQPLPDSVPSTVNMRFYFDSLPLVAAKKKAK
jgi:hypothetical protein